MFSFFNSFFINFTTSFNWLTENDYVTINYGLHRTGAEAQNLLDHLFHPIIFLIKQIGILLPLFVMFLFTISKIKINYNFKDKNYYFY